MAIKKLSELPKGKRASLNQVVKAKKAKAIATKPKIIGSRFGRIEINLGTHDKDDVAGVIKGFRQKFKANFGTTLKDEAGNIIARTHTASGRTTIAEQLAVKALSKYAKQYNKIEVVLSTPRPKPKKATKKQVSKPTKKATKKQVSKPTKKAAKKSMKKVTMKPMKKSSRTTMNRGKKVTKKTTKKNKNVNERKT